MVDFFWLRLGGGWVELNGDKEAKTSLIKKGLGALTRLWSCGAVRAGKFAGLSLSHMRDHVFIVNLGPEYYATRRFFLVATVYFSPSTDYFHQIKL